MYYIFFLIFLLVVIYLSNKILWYLGKKTGRNCFNKIQNNLYYPLLPSNYYKIAIYGGSAAAGYNALINFSTILNHELNLSRINNKKTFVMNFASAGMPFHEGQALIAKKFMDYFDLTIIYSGNNEQQWFLQNIIGAGCENYKKSINSTLDKCSLKFTIIRRIIYNIIIISHLTSFIYFVLLKLHSKITNKINNLINKTNSLDTNIKNNLTAIEVKTLTDKPILEVEQKQKNIAKNSGW